MMGIGGRLTTYSLLLLIICACKWSDLNRYEFLPGEKFISPMKIHGQIAPDAFSFYLYFLMIAFFSIILQNGN